MSREPRAPLRCNETREPTSACSQYGHRQPGTTRRAVDVRIVTTGKVGTSYLFGGSEKPGEGSGTPHMTSHLLRLLSLGAEALLRTNAAGSYLANVMDFAPRPKTLPRAIDTPKEARMTFHRLRLLVEKPSLPTVPQIIFLKTSAGQWPRIRIAPAKLR